MACSYVWTPWATDGPTAFVTKLCREGSLATGQAPDVPSYRTCLPGEPRGTKPQRRGEYTP